MIMRAIEPMILSRKNRGTEVDSDLAKLDFLTHLSDDLVLELCTRLPMKKLLQCMSVSKSWHSIIHHTLSTEAYLRRSPCVLVVQHIGSFYYCSMGQIHEAQQLSKPYNFMEAQKFTNVVKGLVCAYNSWNLFVCNLWSIEIIELPKFPENQDDFGFFFGFDPINGLYKLLAKNNYNERNFILTLGGINCSWRELDSSSSSNMPKSFIYDQTFMADDGVFYWLTWERELSVFNLNEEEFQGREIIGFNFNTETFIVIRPPKMDENRFRYYKLTHFRGRLAMYYTIAHMKLIIHTLDDDKGFAWTKIEAIYYSDELKCRSYIRVVPLPSGDILLVNGGHHYQGGCCTYAYSYNYHNNKFEKFVVGKWLGYEGEDRLENVDLSCEVPNLEDIDEIVGFNQLSC